MPNWTTDTLLPSLLLRYLGRDKRYNGIIVTDKQAAYVGAMMQTGKVCKYMRWNDRDVTLSHRGHYYMLSFGPTPEEQQAARMAAKKTQWAREIESAENQVSRGKVNPFFVRDMQSELSGLNQYITDNDYIDGGVANKADDLERAAHIKKVLAILGY